MFTGIITDLGRVISREGAVLIIESNYKCDDILIGSSISCDGVCLTVIDKTLTTLTFEVSPETDAKTTLSTWTTNKKVNLEQALKVGAELGGHFVTGHVDAVGEVGKIVPAEGFITLEILYPADLAFYFAPKGSVTVNGVSLTVNTVSPISITPTLSVMIIPHTAEVTNLGLLSVGDKVNLEVDVIARYIAPYLQNRTL